MEANDNDKAIAIVAMLGATLFVLYLWFRATGKIAELAAPRLMRASHEAITKVLDRATEITKEAAESAGKEGSQ